MLLHSRPLGVTCLLVLCMDCVCVWMWWSFSSPWCKCHCSRPLHWLCSLFCHDVALWHTPLLVAHTVCPVVDGLIVGGHAAHLCCCPCDDVRAVGPPAERDPGQGGCATTAPRAISAAVCVPPCCSSWASRRGCVLLWSLIPANAPASIMHAPCPLHLCSARAHRDTSLTVFTSCTVTCCFAWLPTHICWCLSLCAAMTLWLLFV